MPIQLDDEQKKLAKAVFTVFAENTSEPYNAIAAELGISAEERCAEGEDYDESNDPVVKRVAEYARLIGAETPPVDEEPSDE